MRMKHEKWGIFLIYVSLTNMKIVMKMVYFFIKIDIFKYFSCDFYEILIAIEFTFIAYEQVANADICLT